MESTAYAQVVTPEAPSNWTITEQPRRIALHLEMVEPLAAKVLESYRAVDSRGSEIGGLLLGHTGSDGATVIEAFEPFSCGYERGPLYLLTEEERARLKDVARGLNRGDSSVVGVFRSNTRRQFNLDEDDLALLEALPQGADGVILLVKPFAAKPPAAALFVQNRGQMPAECAAEFVFRRDAIERTGTPAPAARPLAPVVPIAAKAAPVAPEAPPDVSPAAEARPVPERVEPPAAPRPQPAQPVPQPPAPDLSKTAVPAAPLFGQYAETHSSPKPDAEPVKSGKRGLMIGLALVLVAAAAGAFWYVRLRPASGLAGQTPAPRARLALTVQRNGADLMLTWNRDADWVRTAQKATLSISDGDRKEDVNLDLGLLQSGSVVYSPSSADVGFRMEVTDSAQGKTIGEYVRVLSGARPSPLSNEKVTTNAMRVGQAPAQPTETGDAQPAADSTQPAATPLRTFQAPARKEAPLAARLRPAELEAPNLGQTSSPLPSAPGFGSVNLPAPPPPQEQARSGGEPARAVRRVAPTPARLLRSDKPQYPVLARNMRLSGVVRLQASVGKDGAVKSVRVISGHPLLQGAAMDSVRHWLYEPAQLDGQPVESTVDVSLTFTL